MGSQTKYKERELMFVNIKPIAGADTGDTLKYAFLTNIPAGDRTELGQTAVTPVMMTSVVVGLVAGCSYPKPNRATKRTALRVTSSYHDLSKTKAALRKLGYKIRRFTGNSQFRSGNTSLVQTVYVTVNGVRYAWNQPKVTETNITAAVMATLGVRKAAIGDAGELVFGADLPKPPRAGTTIIAGDDVKDLSTFYDPSATLPDGWTPSGAMRIILNDI